MRYRSKSTLFLIEQLIVIAVFAICAAACISILANAFFLARDTRDISNALLVAESLADSFKTVSGDLDAAAEISGGSVKNIDGTYSIVMFFDNSWLSVDEDDAEYILQLKSENNPSSPQTLLKGAVTVTRTAGDELLAFPVATRSTVNN